MSSQISGSDADIRTPWDLDRSQPYLDDYLKGDGQLTEMGELFVSIGLHLLFEASNRTAVGKGWYQQDPPRTFAEEIGLFHSEVSEALEEFRNGHAPDARYYSRKEVASFDSGRHVAVEIPLDEPEFDGQLTKPEGIGAELADVLIRIGDSTNGRSIQTVRGVIEKLRYNHRRTYRHGGKTL